MLLIVILAFIEIGCQKQNDKITNSTYQIDSIETFLDDIKRVTLIPGDFSIFDSIKQTGDTTKYYLMSNYYDGDGITNGIGASAQKPRILIKDGKLISIDWYSPLGHDGEYGSGYYKTNYYYSNKLDSLHTKGFFFSKTSSYDEYQYYNTTRNPDSLNSSSGSGDLTNFISLYYNYNGNQLNNFYQENSNPYNTIYTTIPNQKKLIGLDINILVLGEKKFFFGGYNGFGGYNFFYVIPLISVNAGISTGIPVADNLLSSITSVSDTSRTKFTFDSLNNNRIKILEVTINSDYGENHTTKYLFHYKN